MSWTEKFSLIIVTAIFSLVGGAAAEHFWPNAVPDLGAASIAKNISAHQFTLIDSAGATRGMMDVTPKGVAELRLFDDTGKLRAGPGSRMTAHPPSASMTTMVKTGSRSASRGVFRACACSTTKVLRA